MKRVTIFDYGAGNLHSLAKALDIDGVEVGIEGDPALAIDTDLLVLPGVGAFAHAAERLAPGREVMRDAILGGLPALGICLGMQLLLDASEEGEGAGLGVVPGMVRRLRAARVPQIGWNEVESASHSSMEGYVFPKTAYFANGYVCEPTDVSTVLAYTDHDGDRFASAVGVHNAIGVQFHPEKSSMAGVRFIQQIVRESAR